MVSARERIGLFARPSLTERGLPLLDHILAKKGQTTNTPVIRLATIWYGTYTPALS